MENVARATVDSGKAPSVKSAKRTVQVLEYLARRNGQGARIREVCDAIGAPKSSTYALLQTLVGEQWVEVDPTGNLYALGIRSLLTGVSYLDADPRVRLIHPILADVVKHIDETVHLGRLDGDQIVYLATIESSQDLRPFSRVGRRLPATATALGKALLAERMDSPGFALPKHIPAITTETVTDPENVLKSLRTTRARGYALDYNESILGVTCVAFALHYTNPPVDAISCSVPVSRLVGDRLDQIVNEMRTARAHIEASAGGAIA